MNKYFSKAIYYTEKKTMRYIIACYSFFYAFTLINLLGSVYNCYKGYTYYLTNPAQLLNTLWFFSICLSIVAVISSYMEKDKQYYFTLTQPYNRDAIVITKTASYIFAFLVPTIIYGAINLITIYSFSETFSKYLGLSSRELSHQFLLQLFSTIALLIFIIMLLQLMEMFFGKSVAALIMPFILYFSFCGSLAMLRSLLSPKLMPIKQFFYNLSYFLVGTKDIYIGPFTITPLFKLFFNYLNKAYLSVSIILIILAAGVFLLSVYINRKIKAENTSDIFLFNTVEVIFKIIFSTGITLILSTLLLVIPMLAVHMLFGADISASLTDWFNQRSWYSPGTYINIIYNLAWIPIYLLVYKLMTKIMNKRRIA